MLFNVTDKMRERQRAYIVPPDIDVFVRLDRKGVLEFTFFKSGVPVPLNRFAEHGIKPVRVEGDEVNGS